MEKAKKAFLFAAGFGSRMVPVTLDTPKPLVKVNGVRIIDTIIDALVEKGIDDITIVRGYKKERFDELLLKYPFLKFVDNNEYDKTNNISSAMKVIDELESCYILDSDLLISNPDLIQEYPECSNIVAHKVDSTDDWCLDMESGYARNYRKGGKNCYQSVVLTYWDKNDSAKLREDLRKVWNSEGGRDVFWEFIPLVNCASDFNVKIRECSADDIIEIDNFYELVELDSSYEGYKVEGE